MVDEELSRGPLGRNVRRVERHSNSLYLSPEVEDALFWQPPTKMERKERGKGRASSSVRWMLNPAEALFPQFACSFILPILSAMRKALNVLVQALSSFIHFLGKEIIASVKLYGAWRALVRKTVLVWRSDLQGLSSLACHLLLSVSHEVVAHGVIGVANTMLCSRALW